MDILMNVILPLSLAFIMFSLWGSGGSRFWTSSQPVWDGLGVHLGCNSHWLDSAVLGLVWGQQKAGRTRQLGVAMGQSFADPSLHSW